MMGPSYWSSLLLLPTKCEVIPFGLILLVKAWCLGYTW
jgi:hypothetical protein